ncbi:MAG: pyruvate, phosphate dikinase [Oscillospiraceae bacterium]
MDKKYTYLFKEGNANMKMLFGGKGANLAEMTNIGLPVPPGLTITTEACRDYFKSGKILSEDMIEQIWASLAEVEKQIGLKFGDKNHPLLVSVRSGAPISMPGMMDTILNLGLNDETVEGLIKATGNERFALDSYRRFIQMFGDVVMGVDHYNFELAIENAKQIQKVTIDKDLDEKSLRNLIEEYKAIVFREKGEQFPSDPKEQLIKAIEAVFSSWYNPRADVYRKINKISEEIGTAVNVQCMVFGNMGDESGTGVAFTRNPANGEKKLYGEYLMNAQGEDVVAGIRTPNPILHLEQDSPEIYKQFVDICGVLEKHYKDVQDIEFTIQDKKLFMLQTRSGKRTAAAAVKIAVDMVREGLITKEEAIMRVDPDSLEQLLHRHIDESEEINVIGKGLPASPGAACGKIVFDAYDAHTRAENGEKVILVRTETTPDDIQGVIAAQGVLTSRGGMTSHAAVVARGMGRCCVCGCEALKIDMTHKSIKISGYTLKENDIISIDGTTGRVILGAVKMVDPILSDDFKTFLEWADTIARMEVKANADTPKDALKAREFGATGIGLCRTEHMFMASDRLPVIQKMIMSETLEERETELAKLLVFQEEDFYGILKNMSGLPTTIRLLDPPLHEFLPDLETLSLEINTLKLQNGDENKIEELETILQKVRALHESNPMMGMRGCRLGIRFPEIYKMQVRAILNATARLIKEGSKPMPEIEMPLVMDKNELELLRGYSQEVADEVRKETGIDVPCVVGSMLELPRACLMAGEIAEFAEFFTFGTNDLTQTTFGFSRDDAEGKFLNHYVNNKILKENPFAVLDREAVGQLVDIATKSAKAKKDIVIGVCGEHGGNPSSIEFFDSIGIDFVSCSPFRVPIARLAAARATVINKK